MQTQWAGWRWGGLLALISACTAEQTGDNPFNSGSGQTSASSPTTAGATSDGDTGEGSSDDDDGLGSSDDGLVGSTGADPSGSTGDPGGDDSSGGDGNPNPNGMQPNAGMYANCLDNSACGAQMCLTITDMAMNPIDGFCTTPCTNPAVDCDASPVATATPACMDTTVNGMASAVCALACSGGAGCPPPMTCYNFGTGEFCG